MYQDVGLTYLETAADKTSQRVLFCTSFRYLAMPLLSAVLPRLCLTGFRFAQPFLITRAIDYVENSLEEKSTGYGLIASAAIVYIGIAVSSICRIS